MKSLKIHLEKSLNLLIADQDDVNLLVHRKMAQATGLFKSIRSATNGLNALHYINMAAEGKVPFPDILLFDLDLPVMNGITLLKVLRKSHINEVNKISFVVLSSYISDKQKQVAASLGVSVFLAKPLDEESFTDLINSIHRHHQETQMTH